ncbi:MAG TPA: gluconokinase [Cyclobacteriaceae bacterium]|nr:gluconokinase [Cyclobacteriaceae bacterium]
MPAILAVDIGTTSAKALVVTSSGQVLVSERVTYPTHRPRSGYAEQDPDQLLTSISLLMKDVIRKANGKIDAVSFSSAMHSMMAINKEGHGLTPLMIWADLRAKGESARIRKEHPELHARTGTPIHPMSPFTKLVWIKNHQPEIFDRAHKFMGIKEYLWQHWFGSCVVDYSIASATGLMDSEKLMWSTATLDIAGITEDRLPKPVDIHAAFSSLKINQEFGLPPHTPWIIGSSDGCLATLASDVHSDSVLSMTIGTSGAARRMSTKPGIDAAGKTFCYCLDKDRWVRGGATNNGTVLIDWYTQRFLPAHVDLKTFCARAAQVSPGAEGLLMLPYLQGERAPVYDADASGVFLGIRHQHGHEHFMRAILEGIGFALLDIAEALIEGNTKLEVRASGGLSRSPAAMQILADQLGMTIRVQHQEDASAIGAAIIACEAQNIPFQYADGPALVYQPDMNHHPLYRRFFSIYKGVYSHLAADLHQLNTIQF